MYNKRELGIPEPFCASRDDSYFVKETCNPGETFEETLTRGDSRMGAGSKGCFRRGHSTLSDVLLDILGGVDAL